MEISSKQFTYDDLIELSHFIFNNKDGLGCSTVPHITLVKDWLNQRHKKAAVKEYLKKAMINYDVCLSGFDEFFEKFYSSNQVPF